MEKAAADEYKQDRGMTIDGDFNEITSNLEKRGGENDQKAPSCRLKICISFYPKPRKNLVLESKLA